MTRPFVNLLLGVALLAGTSAMPAYAKDHGQGRGRAERRDRDDRKHAERDRNDNDDVRRGDRDRDERRGSLRSDDRPPGWSKGKKTGWGNCDVPPGQAKKV